MGEHFARRGASGIYYSRLRVPADLVEKVGRKEVTKSLGTTDRRLAKKRTREWIGLQEEEFERLRKGRELSETDLKAVAVEHYITGLDLDERHRVSRPSFVEVEAIPLTMTERAERGDFALPNPLEQLASDMEVLIKRSSRQWEANGRRVRLAALQEHLSKENFALVERAADEFIAARSLQIERNGYEYRLICNRILRAEIEAVSRAIERDSGNYGGKPADPLLSDTSVSLDTSTFEDLIKKQEVRSNNGIDGRIAPGTFKKYRTQIGEYVKWRGSSRVATITVEEVERWRDELLQSNSRKTVKDKIGAVRAVANWGQKQSKGKLFPNGVPLDHLDLPVVETHDGAKKTYTIEQARAILSAARTADKNYKRWIPFLMAYSGARVGELVVLEKEDFMSVDGHWFYTIQVDGQSRTTKTMKTRRIPVHPALIDEGLLKFVQSAPPGRLFPEPRCEQNLRDWIRDDVAKPEGQNKPAPCHGLRHLFEDLRRNRLNQEAANYITGRANRGSDALYGNSQVMLPALAEEMKKFPRIL